MPCEECEATVKRLEEIVELVNQQAEDEEVWFTDDAGIVRFNLRNLHACIEAD